MNISVVGIGYVGLSNGVLLSQTNNVILYDLSQEKVDMVNLKKSPIVDAEIETYLKDNQNISATTSYKEAFANAELIIIATPTNYDEVTNYFDTSSIEQTIDKINEVGYSGPILIKSTIPIGYTEKIKKDKKMNNIIFMPEFLREGKALYDNLYPSRIVIGENSEIAKKIVQMYLESSLKENIDVLYTGSTEAETIKLFSNTYLAMRVAYFNELDMYAESNNLNTQEIIEGVCLDPRIGMYYNNPSFGYGGYCLPKDTKQLLANFDNIPNKLIRAIVESNTVRKNYIFDRIMSFDPKVVGVYRLVMKHNSDNFRKSAIQDIITKFEKENVKVIIYEPTLNCKYFDGYEVVNNLEDFKIKADIILANRISDELSDVLEKIYTRDIFSRD